MICRENGAQVNRKVCLLFSGPARAASLWTAAAWHRFAYVAGTGTVEMMAEIAAGVPSRHRASGASFPCEAKPKLVEPPQSKRFAARVTEYFREGR